MMVIYMNNGITHKSNKLFGKLVINVSKYQLLSIKTKLDEIYSGILQ